MHSLCMQQRLDKPCGGTEQEVILQVFRWNTGSNAMSVSCCLFLLKVMRAVLDPPVSQPRHDTQEASCVKSR